MLLEWKRNLMAHGDAREEKWRGKRRMVWVVSSFQFDSEQSIQCYYNRSPPTLTPRKPVLDWTDTPADINGLVRFAGRPNLVSARVPSHPVFTLPLFKLTTCFGLCAGTSSGHKIYNCGDYTGWIINKINKRTRHINSFILIYIFIY